MSFNILIFAIGCEVYFDRTKQK